MKKNYMFLDSLRGIAILLVLVSHIHFIGVPISPKIEVLLIGVSLFFMISAYTLMLSESSKRSSSNFIKTLTSGWSHFYIRRFFRIYPLFFLIVTVVFLLSFWSNIFASVHEGVNGFVNYFMHITFLFGFSPYTMNTFHLGERSLFNEAIFYLSFPLLFGLAKKGWKWSLGLVFTSIIIYKLWDSITMGAMLYPYIHNIPERRLYVFHFPLYHLPEFMVGFLLYYIHKKRYTSPLSSKLQYIFSIIHLTIFIYLIYSNMQGVYISNLIWVVMFTILIWLMMQGGGIYKIFNNILFVSIGKLSYSLYLLNLPVFFTMRWFVINMHLNPWLGVLIALGCLCILTHFTYKFENYFIAIGSKYIKKN